MGKEDMPEMADITTDALLDDFANFEVAGVLLSPVPDLGFLAKVILSTGEVAATAGAPTASRAVDLAHHRFIAFVDDGGLDEGAYIVAGEDDEEEE